MSDKTNPYNDVIRRQQERDLGHPLDHGRDTRGAPPDNLRRPLQRPRRNRRDVILQDRMSNAKTSRKAELEQEE